MNTLRILEISWLVFGISGVVLCLYNLFTESVQAALWPLLFTIVALIFYTVRRKQRIAYERNRHTSPTETE